MRFITLLILFSVFILATCSSRADDPLTAPGKFSVSQEQAIEFARSNLHLREIEDASIRALEQGEMKARPPEVHSMNPIYYVIKGKDQSNHKVNIYVSVQDLENHFVIVDETRH